MQARAASSGRCGSVDVCHKEKMIQRFLGFPNLFLFLVYFNLIPTTPIFDIYILYVLTAGLGLFHEVGEEGAMAGILFFIRQH